MKKVTCRLLIKIALLTMFTIFYLFITKELIYDIFIGIPSYSSLHRIKGDIVIVSSNCKYDKQIKKYVCIDSLHLLDESKNKINLNLRRCDILINKVFHQQKVEFMIDYFNRVYECKINNNVIMSYQETIKKYNSNYKNNILFLTILCLLYIMGIYLIIKNRTYINII